MSASSKGFSISSSIHQMCAPQHYEDLSASG
jgi:hypothetical protein